MPNLPATPNYVLAQMIEKYQLAQHIPSVEEVLGNNKGHIQDLIQAVEHFQETGQDPVVIGVNKVNPNRTVAGHAIVPYKVEQLNPKSIQISVYDCNYPGEERRMFVFKDGEKWNYDVYDHTVTFVPVSVIVQAMGNNILRSLDTDGTISALAVSDSNMKIAAGSIDAAIYNAAGLPVESIPGAYEIYTYDDAEHSNRVCSAPAGEYRVESASAGFLDDAHYIDVETSDSAAVISGVLGVAPAVGLEAKGRHDFSVQLSSEEDAVLRTLTIEGSADGDVELEVLNAQQTQVFGDLSGVTITVEKDGQTQTVTQNALPDSFVVEVQESSDGGIDVAIADATPVTPTEAPAEPTSAPTETPAEPTAAPTDAPVEPTVAPTEPPAEPTTAPTPPAASDAALASLTVDQGTLSPVFAPATTSYRVNVGRDISSITLTAVASNAKAVVSGDGRKSLSTGENPFTITVKAEDGVTTLDYTVVVTRASGSGGGSGGSPGGGGTSGGGSDTPTAAPTPGGGSTSGSGPASSGSSTPSNTAAEVTGAGLPFTDVPTGAWYYGDVAWAYRNGLMVGTDAGSFSPNMPVTRGMLVTVLYRMAGEPSVVGAPVFGDVAEDSWYARAVAWARENGIVSGVGDNRFAPEDSVTREQTAAILLNYAGFAGVAPQGAWAAPLDFADTEAISDWAARGAMYCYMKGIIGGKPGNLFDPQGQATRAEISAILRRFAGQTAVR